MAPGSSRPKLRSSAAGRRVVSAIALAASGVETLLIAPAAADDHRTTALLASSVTALVTLGVWQACQAHAAPLAAIRVVDDSRRLLRAPEVGFTAAEIGLDAFGYNIENRHLLAALSARAAELKLSQIAAGALAVASDSDGITIKLPESARGSARDRSRWAALALPGGGGYRHRPPRLSADGAHAQSSGMIGRTRTRRPNSTPKADRSRSCPCPAAARALSVCSIRCRPRRLQQ